MENNSTIIFVILYFGDYAWYIPHFIKSCKFNPSINFLILSDLGSKFKNIPDNVTIKDYSVSEFQKVASQSLGFPISIETNYKICDFRPAIGYIFPDLIKGYDFWGYCDLDVIFGNIRSFITEDLLSKYDVISARHDYLTGCFSLFRNNSTINNLFKYSKDYKKVFTNKYNYCFDEASNAYIQFMNNTPINKIKSEVQSMTEVIKRLDSEKKIRAYFDFLLLEGLPGNILWDNGTLVFKKEYEILLYHLIKLKTIYSENIDVNKNIPNKFKITKKGIFYPFKNI
ncbi:MAG: hypothetical protein J6K31_05890 [Parabacteroides sp.]|nr:hypothetical protein [Parabacteroides sp.]